MTKEVQTSYVINSAGSYFIVVGPLDHKYMKDCEFYPSCEDLYLAAADIMSTKLSDVVTNIYTFTKDPNETDYPWKMKGFDHNPRGKGTRIFTEFTIEYYLSKWSL